jgi:hypothetical protein
VTPFAGDDERIQARSRGVKHGNSIGEYKAKIPTGLRLASPWPVRRSGRGTWHALICPEVMEGLSRSQLSTQRPIVFGITGLAAKRCYPSDIDIAPASDLEKGYS